MYVQFPFKLFVAVTDLLKCLFHPIGNFPFISVCLLTLSCPISLVYTLVVSLAEIDLFLSGLSKKTPQLFNSFSTVLCNRFSKCCLILSDKIYLYFCLFINTLAGCYLFTLMISLAEID